MSSGGQQKASEQTTITELPAWAKPYAQDVLSKGQALTDVKQNPYQTYGAPRVAGFSPMEEQSFSGAANLAPSQAGLAGQGVALGASLGAMDTGQFGPRQAQRYMNPYLESALAPQMELMRRQQGAQAQQMAGQATLAGAFGGSRYGLGQVQQNLANQLAQQNLVGQGYNTAYQNAMAQFNADQARRLQGLQTSLQGAQTLGGLGQQQFGQQAQAIGIQNQLGGQQRGLEQQGLDVAYQDFLNQQNYPYRQLGFMSDLLRGTPTGQSTTTNMYQTPGSIMGQLGGIGMGAYGLSKAGLFKEGGEVDSYAEGGETDLDMLSDDQLKVSYQNALARGDILTAQAIQTRLAENTALRNAQQASLSRGLGYAFDQLPAEQQNNVISAAGGGIVAFAGGGNKGEYYQDPLGTPSAAEPDDSGYSIFKQDIREGEEYSPNLLGMLFGYNRLPPKEKKAAETKSAAPSGTPYDPLTATRREDFSDAPPAKAPAKAPATASGAAAPTPAKSITEAVKRTSMPDAIKQMQEVLNDPESAKLIQENADEIKRYAARAEDVKKQRGANALAEFGFRMAAEASKPGSTFFGSAAAASPTITESLKKSEEVEQRMADNAMKMRQLQNQSVIAMRKGDRQSAIQGAAQLRMLEQSQEQLALQRDQLAETIRAHKATESIHREQQNKPSETERILAKVENIRSGKESYAGMTGEEGVAAYTAAMGDVGAARYGVRYSGQNKDIERYTNILKDDQEYKMLKVQRSQLAGQAEPNDKQRAKLARIDNRIAEIEARARSSAGMGQGAGPVQGAPQVPPQAIAALRADPRLRDQFDAKYGRGSADRYLGD